MKKPGPSSDLNDTTDAALNVFVEAISRHDARVKKLWFDVTSAVSAGIAPEA